MSITGAFVSWFVAIMFFMTGCITWNKYDLYHLDQNMDPPVGKQTVIFDVRTDGTFITKENRTLSKEKEIVAKALTECLAANRLYLKELYGVDPNSCYIDVFLQIRPRAEVKGIFGSLDELYEEAYAGYVTLGIYPIDWEVWVYELTFDVYKKTGASKRPVIRYEYKRFIKELFGLSTIVLFPAGFYFTKERLLRDNTIDIVKNFAWDLKRKHPGIAINAPKKASPVNTLF